MLMIRLQRVGKKHDPSFRVVLTDSRKGPKSGAFLEILGNYNAQKGEPQFKGDRIKHWMTKGAQLSDTAHNLLVKAKILEGKKRDVLSHTKIKQAKDKKAGEEKPDEKKEEIAEKVVEEITEKTEAIKEEEKPKEEETVEKTEEAESAKETEAAKPDA